MKTIASFIVGSARIMALAASALAVSACAAAYRPGSLASLAATGKLDLEPPRQTQDPWAVKGDWELERGVFVRHFSSGSGKPVLVLHGGPGVPSDSPWEALASLGGTWRFIYPQERGSGSSSRPIDRWQSADWGRNLPALEAGLGLTAQVADIERIRRLLGLEKLTIIGHSWGGFRALLYAIEFPEHVERLVLISPATVLKMPPPADADLYSGVEARLSGEEKTAFQAWKKDFFDYGPMWSKGEGDWRRLNEAFVPYFEAASASRGATWGDDPLPAPEGGIGGWVQPASFFSLGQAYDLWALADAVTCPAWLLVGDRDLIPLSAWNEWRASIPGLRELVLEGAGHFPMRDVRFTPIVARALDD